MEDEKDDVEDGKAEEDWTVWYVDEKGPAPVSVTPDDVDVGMGVE